MKQILWFLAGYKTYTIGIFFILVTSYLFLTKQLTLEFGIYLLICEYALLSMTTRSAMGEPEHPAAKYVRELK